MNCQCVDFDEGDFVQSCLNPDVFGIVVGNSNFGQFVHVQLAVTLQVQIFYSVTMQHMQPAQPEPPVNEEEEPESNVIHADFTKSRKLNTTTKTAGRV